MPEKVRDKGVREALATEMNPRAFVIAILSLPESVASAWRCIDSASQFGLKVTIWPATTPAGRPWDVFYRRGWNPVSFEQNRYSRPEPCMACFCSHASLWDHCVISNEPVLVLEHDAVQVAPLPYIPNWMEACNLSKPSYGRFTTPPDGFSPMKHKPAPHYMGGATGYFVRPSAAWEFLKKASEWAEPTDVYLNLARFPFLRDAYPWPIECRDEVSTIQNKAGCAAKHNAVRIV